MKQITLLAFLWVVPVAYGQTGLFDDVGKKSRLVSTEAISLLLVVDEHEVGLLARQGEMNMVELGEETLAGLMAFRTEDGISVQFYDLRDWKDSGAYPEYLKAIDLDPEEIRTSDILGHDIALAAGYGDSPVVVSLQGIGSCHVSCAHGGGVHCPSSSSWCRVP